jgi:hypothetical protein
MSDFPNPAQSPEAYEFYAFIVDNEVAVVMPVSSAMPLHNAVFSSDPIIKKLSSEQKNIVVQGWTWDGTEFVAPQ